MDRLRPEVTGPSAVLGIDLGTSQVKALLCAAADGTVLGQGVAGYQVSTPRDGWAETDPEQWWRAAAAAVRSATGPGPAGVAGIAVVGQMHGLVLYAERSGALRPAILWLDRRADAEAGDYQRLPDALRTPLGNAPSAGMAGPILLWLARHEPAAYRQADWMLQPKDWLRTRLTGRPCTDPTDASGTLLYDLDRGDWAAGLAEALGLRTGLLPPILESAQVAGTLLPAAAEHLGLHPGIPVAAGASDTAASLHAVSVSTPSLAPGWGLLTLGTGGQWIIPGPGTPQRPAAGTNLFRSADGGTFRLAGAQNVGVTLDWVRQTLGASWAELYDTAARPWRPDPSRGPVFLPYLAGERWEHRDSGGAWTGLALAHQRDDLLRAALEGVAFLLRGQLDDLRAAGSAPVRVLLAGGGSRPAAWRQLLADALGVPLQPAADPAAGWLTARGAALLAARAAGMVTGAGPPDRSDHVLAVVEPRETAAAERAYREFRSARA
jgi:xylulokinase